MLSIGFGSASSPIPCTPPTMPSIKPNAIPINDEKRIKYQYSARRDRPSKTAYFFNATINQYIAPPFLALRELISCPPISLNTSGSSTKIVTYLITIFKILGPLPVLVSLLASPIVQKKRPIDLIEVIECYFCVSHSYGLSDYAQRDSRRAEDSGSTAKQSPC